MIRDAIVGVCVVVAVSASAAMGGTILFTPDEVTIDPAVDPTVFTFDLTIGSSSLTMFDSIDFFMGSDDLTVTEYDPWCHWDCFFWISFPDTSVYASGWTFGHFGPSRSAEGFWLGWLTVDAAGLPNGTYSVMVDAGRDGGRSSFCGGGECEPLYGLATVHVVPEPATSILLALGALGLACRHRVVVSGSRTGCVCNLNRDGHGPVTRVNAAQTVR